MIIVYCTTPSLNEAKVIAEALVNSKLAACVNIIDNIKSFYLWKDKVCNDSETVMIIKTKKELFSQVQTKIKELHSYDTPCVLSIPVDNVEKKFDNWVNSVCT